MRSSIVVLACVACGADPSPAEVPARVKSPEIGDGAAVAEPEPPPSKQDVAPEPPAATEPAITEPAITGPKAAFTAKPAPEGEIPSAPLGEAPPLTDTIVMAGVFQFIVEQDLHGVPCRIDLVGRSSTEVDGVAAITVGPSGRIRLLRKQTLAGTTRSRMEFGYDPEGRLISVGSPFQWLKLEYDEEGRLAKRRYGHGSCEFAQIFEYTEDGGTVAEDNGCDGTIDVRHPIFERDAKGHWNYVSDHPAGAAFEYDAEGRLLATTAGGKERLRMERDAEGRIVRVTPLDSTWISAARADLIYECAL